MLGPWAKLQAAGCAHAAQFVHSTERLTASVQQVSNEVWASVHISSPHGQERLMVKAVSVAVVIS